MLIGATQCNMTFSGFTGAGSWQGSDLQNAVADLPYPTCPMPCSGYSTTVAAPANDQWWRMDNLSVFGIPVEVELTATDTCHVTWWKGSCPLLTPICCYTLLPNVTTLITPWQSVIEDTLFMQISGIHLTGGPLSFNGCILRSGPMAINPAQLVSPTPVTCAALSYSVVPASSSTDANGQIDVTVLYGLPPFQIQWADGDTNFIRTDLAVGSYPFVLSDSLGCQQWDTVIVGVDWPTMFGGLSDNGIPVTIAQANAALEVTIGSGALPSQCSITDLFGRTLISQELNTTVTVIETSDLGSQLVILCIRNAQGAPQLIRKLRI